VSEPFLPPVAAERFALRRERAGQWLRPLLINAGLLTLVVLAAAAGSQFRIRFPQIPQGWFTFDPAEIPGLEPVPEITGPALPPEEIVQYEASRWPYIILAIIVLLIIGFFVFRYFWRRRDMLRELPIEPEPEEEDAIDIVRFEKKDLVDAVALAQFRMAEARTPSDAVVAGWVAFEEAASTRGWVREPQETTTEFTARLLAASHAPAQPVAKLRGLYQQGRFGARPPTDDDVAAARAALTDIAENISAIPDITAEHFPTTPATGAQQSEQLVPTVVSGVTRNKWGED